MDLSQLLGGTAFTIACTVSNNGLGIKTSSLIDTGANGHTFIDTKFVKTVERFLGVSPSPLKTPCKVRGFDGQQTTPITHAIELALMVDGWRVKTPMLIVGLGDHDMILGRKWFAETGVLVDCKNRRLIWPDTDPQARNWGRVLATTRKTLEAAAADPQHQKDADRRDSLMAITPRTILRRPLSTKPAMQRKDQAKEYKKMHSQLEVRDLQEKASAPRRPPKSEESAHKSIDICRIAAPAFRANMHRKDNVLFTTSIYEIDQELSSRKPVKKNEDGNPAGTQQDGETELQWLKRILPEEFKDYADVFSQEASNELLPHWLYNHMIKIEDLKGPKD